MKKNEVKIEFETPSKDVAGIIYLEDAEITAHWHNRRGSWYDPYNNGEQILQFIGKILNYPVVEEYGHYLGNGHYSAILKKATPEEAALQTKIAQCQNLSFWSFNYFYIRNYKRFEKMQTELGEALLKIYEDGWVINASLVNKLAFCKKWSDQALQDAIEAARTKNWQEAACASYMALKLSHLQISSIEVPAGEPLLITQNLMKKISDAGALHIIARSQLSKQQMEMEKKLVLFVICLGGGSLQFEENLQKHLNKFCENFELSPFPFNKIIQDYIDEP